MRFQALLPLSAWTTGWLVVYGARRSASYAASGWTFIAACRYVALLALLTLPRRPLALWMTGTKRTSNVDTVRTSSASGAPPAG